MKTTHLAGALAVAMLLAAGTFPARAAVPEALPSGAKVAALEAWPASIELRYPFAYRQLLLTARLESGDRVDVTRIARQQGSSPLVKVSADGLVRPSADGQGEILFSLAGKSVGVPVTVAGLGEKYEASFVRDIMPAMSKLGCNAGTCHGAAKGRNGFKLSLRGYDAAFDHAALTDDDFARRFNRVAPDQSLMLLKASGSIPHVGGVRCSPGDPHYELLRSWIAGGVKFDAGSPRVVSIDVFPKNPVLPTAGMTQQMAVLATYGDGSVRDVSRQAFIEAGDIEVVEADASGRITSLRRGESAVLVRYEGSYAATTLTVMGDRTGYAWSDPPAYNYIDEKVYAKHRQVKVLPGDLCTDEEFLRRATIDLTGLPPTADEVRAFLTDPRPSREKRDAAVDRLVGSRAYVEHWTNKWADLLQVNRKFLGEAGAMAFRNWIKDSVGSNKPYDRMAHELLTASGSNMENPAAAYWKIQRQPSDLMENTTHLFLAVRFNCNKCHDHPFERWTQDQYYSLSAYFARVGRKDDPAFAGQKIGGSAVEGAQPLVEVVYDQSSGNVQHLRTGQTAEAGFPYALADGSVPSGDSYREQLAAWVVSRDNPYFARSYVNRLWGYHFGRGIIEPIDDIRAGNPPTNPELLEALTADFMESGFDIQHMLKTICKSRTYQLSSATNRWNEDDQINYSHAIPRRLPAEVLFDAIHVATGSTPRISGVPAGFRAAEIPDAGVDVPFLNDFGRPVRESACECERSSGIVIGPVMKLVNGPTVAGAIADPQNALTRLAAEKDDHKVIEEMFLRFLGRRPTAAEMEFGIEALKSGQGEEKEARLAGLQDLAWALINNPAFLFNH